MEIANGLSVQGLLDGKRNKMTRNVEVDWLNPGATKKSEEKAGQRKSPASGALANENVSCQLAFEHKCSVDRRAQQKAQVAITLLAARNISFYAKTLSQLNFCTLLGGGLVDASCNDSMQELSAKKEKKDLIKDLKDLINGGIFSSFCIVDRFFLRLVCKQHSTAVR